MRGARRAADKTARGRRRLIVGADIRIADGHLARQVALLRARQPRRRAVVRQHQRVLGDLGDRRAAALAEAQGPVLLAGVEGEGQRQRIEHGARRHWPVNHVAVGPLAQFAAIDAGDAAVGEQRADQPVERRRAQPSGQPMPGRPVGRVAPHVARRRKGRIGPRVPGPQMNAVRRHHARAIHGRDWIERARAECGIEGTEHGFQIAALDQVVARAGGKIRQAVFRRLRIGKHARLVGALVHRRTADLGEPDRL